MPYAREDYTSSRCRSRSISSSNNSGVGLMPPEPLPPWDRKGELFRDRKNGFGGHHGYNHHRWRDAPSSPFPSGSRNSGEFSPRWGYSSEFRRPPGHIKQGGWNMYQEDSPHGYSTPRNGDRFLDDDCIRPSGPRGDNNRHGRFYRDNRNGFNHKDGRGNSWENNYQYNGPSNTPGRGLTHTPGRGPAYNPGHAPADTPERGPSYTPGRGSADTPGRGASHTPGRGPADTPGRGPAYTPARGPVDTPVRGPASTPARGPAETPACVPTSNSSQKLVDESPVSPCLPNSKKQIDRPGDTNGLGETQKSGKENSLGSLDWKPLKWSRSGSLISRGSGISYSSSSKSNGGESNDVGEGDLGTAKKVTPVQSPSGDAVACGPHTGLTEETSSRKKPRLGWGEGLAKYEKKKVDVPEDSVMKMENSALVVNVEPTQSVSSGLIDKSPKITGFFGCSSPVTPSSFACSSSPGLEKTYGKSTDGYPNNFSVSSMPIYENQPEEMQFILEKLELNSVANLSALLSQLLQVDDQCSMNSGFMRSSAFNKLVLWKDDISKALELTEAEIDSLDNELQLLKPDSGKGVANPGSSSLLLKNDKDGNFDGQSGFTKPPPLEVVPSENTTMKNTISSKDESIVSPGVATSDVVGPLCTQNPLSPCGRKNSSSPVPEILCTLDDEEINEGISLQGVVDDPGVSVKVDNICDIILTSNKDTAAKASEVLIKLLPSDNNVNGIEAKRLSCSSADNIKEKFLRRNRRLKFKERVLSLKYRALYHHWKEDLRLNSLTSQRTKHHKKVDLIPRTMQTGNQKHRLSIRSRFASPAGSSSLVPTTEILNYTKKLLSEPQVKTYRSNLKMPAMMLDEKERKSSIFVSSNGLVENPCAVEKERALINPWTTEEKELFMEKLSSLGKDFGKIASFLDHKTVADCVQFYYKNHKSECFKKTKKLRVRNQAYPSDTYMRSSSTKKWGNRETNSASLDVLGAASVIAAQADQAMKTSKSFSGKLSNNRKFRSSNGILETSTCFNIAEDERETVAADVLAGICGSFSSEPMSSCITSSVKRPLTPYVTQNVDVDADEDDTCSDESFGEMDPADWTDDEKSLFVQAFTSHGKDFLMISRFVRTKTRKQCKVFFSKARKCLGLEISQPESSSGGVRGSIDTNCSGSDVEDAVGVVEKSGSQMDEELPRVSEDSSVPNSDDVDLSTSAELINCGPGELECKEVDIEPEVLCSSHYLANIAENDDLMITQDDQSKDLDPKLNEVININISVSQDGICKQPTDLTGVSLDLSKKAGVNGDVIHKAGPEKKVHPIQEFYFRKCKNSVTTNHGGASDTKKPSSNGDVKLFGKILSKPSSTNHNRTPVAEQNGFVGLENVPVSNYGIWDGREVKVVSYPTSTNSSSALLEKYPSAFASETVQVNSGECNLNNACSFSPREYNGGDSRISPFMFDYKQRGNNMFPGSNISDPVAVLRSQFSGQRYNGGGGGSSSSSGVDKVVNGVIREEAWGGQGDVGR